jgi:DNA-binding transcriptional ArsR family regulator
MTDEDPTYPRLIWDIGTAYDLFICQRVLHDPKAFGVRGSWAAGVRARLPAAQREVLEQAQSAFLGTTLNWVHHLPGPKDGATALYHLARIAPSERLPALGLSPQAPQEVTELLHRVAARGTWSEPDAQLLREQAQAFHAAELSKPRMVARLLDTWAHAAEFGERYLAALRTFYEAFFVEEERRIRPALESALERGQALAERLPLPELYEALSQGVRFVEAPDVEELVLVPSFWSTPLVLFDLVTPQRAIWTFGAKPPDAALVPGEVVPDALLGSLKALSDPSRLRILHYVAQEPATAAELARKLRLRIPTVTHHLGILRLAGLVQLTVEVIEGQDRDVYGPRFEAVDGTFAGLNAFLGRQDGDSD